MYQSPLDARASSDKLKETTKRYVQRVLLILLIQLGVLNLAVAWYFYATVFDSALGSRGIPTAQAALDSASHPVILIVSIGVVLVIWALMYIWADDIAGVWPVNVLLLTLFTLASAYVLVAICAESNVPTAVANTVFLVTLLVLVQLLYASLPCCRTYSFTVATVLTCLVIAILAAWFIVPATREARDAYLFRWNVDWDWAFTQDNTKRDLALNSVSLWVTLLLTLFFAALFQYQLWSLTRRRGKHIDDPMGDPITGAFELYVYMAMLFVFAVQTAATIVQTATGYLPCFNRVGPNVAAVRGNPAMAI